MDHRSGNICGDQLTSEKTDARRVCPTSVFQVDVLCSTDGRDFFSAFGIDVYN